MTNGPIIVFDSGVGGLSIYRPLRAALPNENIVYIADSAYFPYGDKSSEWLLKRFRTLARQFSDLSPHLIVLACNSATTNVISEVRSLVACQVVGVEPVIKPLARYKSSLALMTDASAHSEATAILCEKYGKNVHIYVPHGLASAIEFNDYEQVKRSVGEIKKMVQKYHVEAVGLSCTHYPLIMPILKKAMPSIAFIDPAPAVVRQVQKVLRLS